MVPGSIKKEKKLSKSADAIFLHAVYKDGILKKNQQQNH